MTRGPRFAMALSVFTAAAAFAEVRWMRAPGATGAGPPADFAQPESPLADWCAPGFDPIPGGGCLAAPSPRPGDPSLVVYLHGRYPRDAPYDEVDRQRRLGERATARGFGVLALRGLLGQCTAPELAGWFCWPSNEHNADDAPAFVKTWSKAVLAAERRVGSHKRYVLGFSNGGYFAGLLAVRGLFEADAFVVAHGGPVEPVRPYFARTPLLLLSADDDVSQDEMIRFHEDLLIQEWPHDSYARSGGHALTDEDIDAAIAFFSRSSEPLPLEPPLPLHRPVRHAASTEDAAALSGEDAHSREDASSGESASVPEPEDDERTGAISRSVPVAGGTKSTDRSP